MSPITTHILDTAKGCPARGVAVELSQKGHAGAWIQVGSGVTNDDGRVTDLMEPGSLQKGDYKVSFATGAYQPGFFPKVDIHFTVEDEKQHYHVPLLLSPYGYSTYRGS